MDGGLRAIIKNCYQVYCQYVLAMGIYEEKLLPGILSICAGYGYIRGTWCEIGGTGWSTSSDHTNVRLASMAIGEIVDLAAEMSLV